METGSWIWLAQYPIGENGFCPPPPPGPNVVLTPEEVRLLVLGLTGQGGPSVFLRVGVDLRRKLGVA